MKVKVSKVFAKAVNEPTRATMINNFCEAIALCSKPWQVEDLLNRHWQIKGGKFYEQS